MGLTTGWHKRNCLKLGLINDLVLPDFMYLAELLELRNFPPVVIFNMVSLLLPTVTL